MDKETQKKLDLLLDAGDLEFDAEKTMMQETGGFKASGMTLANVMEVVMTLGLDPKYVAIESGTTVWLLDAKSAEVGTLVAEMYGFDINNDSPEEG